MISGGGLTNISINSNTSYVVQQINIMYLNSATPVILTNALSCW
jgi:hypothetical protein